jgi:ATP-dependent Clp endopeptidase proteolytic subunit ClpP
LHGRLSFSITADQSLMFSMQLVPAVTELMVAELLYLEKQGNSLPIEMLINSSGTTRQDGEILSFDSEGIAVTSTMGFVKNPISTVNMGLAVGWSCVILSFGKKGWRKSLPHSLAMIQQPRVPPTGQRQAIEVHIKWREVLDYKRDLLRMLSIGTGWPVDKLDADMQRPLYMRPQDALEYGVIDEIIQPDAIKQQRAVEYWVKSGRAESEGRLEQWQEYLALQEEYALKDSFKKVIGQDLRDSYREVSEKVLGRSRRGQEAMARFKGQVPQELVVTGEDGEEQVRLPFTKKGLKMALLNAERYAERNVQRHVESSKVQVPERWAKEVEEATSKTSSSRDPQGIDFDALIAQVDAMSAEEFSRTSMDALVDKHTTRS